MGLIGRAWANGRDSSPNVQKLDGKESLRLEAAKKHSVRRTVAFLAADSSAVECFSGDDITAPDDGGIKACFESQAHVRALAHPKEIPVRFG